MALYTPDVSQSQKVIHEGKRQVSRRPGNQLLNDELSSEVSLRTHMLVVSCGKISLPHSFRT